MIRLARAARGLPEGATIVLLADDVAAWSDVPAWARMKGHSVTLHDEADGWTAYRVVIGPQRPGGQAAEVDLRSLQRLGEAGEVGLARPLLGAQAPEVVGGPLHVDEPSRVAVGMDPLDEADEGDLRRVPDRVEHRLPREQAADRDAVQAPDELAVLPGLDAVRPPSSWRRP